MGDLSPKETTTTLKYYATVFLLNIPPDLIINLFYS